MSKLIIANVDNEHQVADVSSYSRHEKSEIILCNQRMMWMARPGDIVVVPTAPEHEILAYWAELNSCSVDELLVLAPRGNTPQPFLRQSVLFDPDFLESCCAAISALAPERRPTEVLAYFPDNYIAEFAMLIGVAVADGFLREGGATLLNQKTTFRKIAAGLGVALPEGRVCDNAADLRRAILHFVNRSEDFIVKLDRHSGGFGNLIVHGPRSAGKVYGSSTVLRYENPVEGEALCRDIIARINEAAVVERYVDTDDVLYSEYFIEAPGRYFLLNDGTMDMKPLWVGFEIPGNYATQHRTRFLDDSARLVAAAAQMGHRGHINVDGLVAEGRVFVNEINGRCGGCSHIFEIASRLFGPGVLARKQIKTYNHGSFGVRGQLVASLSRANLLLRPGDASGVIPLNVDYDLSKAFEYMVVADTIEEARRLSDLALAATSQSQAA